MKRLPRLFRFSLLGLLVAFGTITHGSAESIPPIAPGLIRVELADGRSYTGRPVSFRDDILLLRSRIDGGEVDRGFPRDRIVRLHFPGEETVEEALEALEAGDLAQALVPLESIWRQRAPFLALLEPETIDLLTRLPVAHLNVGDPFRAIGLARSLTPHAATPPAAARLQEALLLGHYQLEYYDLVEEMARDWIRRQPPFPDSALGWKILAALALQEDDFDQVSWRALHPVAFAGPEPIPYLAECYAMAIHAADRRHETDGAVRLYKEMQSRRLNWPPSQKLAETGARYATLAEETKRTPLPQAAPDLDLRPPEDDLNLPIRQVRKLLTDS